MKIEFYFDDINKLEYTKNGNEYISSPLGQSLIEFVEEDFLSKVNNDFSNPTILNNSLLKVYPDIKAFNDDLKNVLYSITELKTAIITILSHDFHPEFRKLSPSQRLYYYQKYYDKNILGLSVKVRYEWLFKSEIDLSFEVPKNIQKNDMMKIAADIVKNSESDILQIYEVEDVLHAGYIILLKMITNNVNAKKCMCCDKLFIPSGRIDTEYCNRIAPNSKKTCSEIGAVQKYKRKAKENPISMEFQKVYKRLNARVKTKKIKQLQFYEWSEKARALRDKAISESMDLEEFKQELNILEV